MSTNSKELLQHFKAHLVGSGLSSATVVNYLADLRAFLRWGENALGAHFSAYALTPADIKQYCAFLTEDKGHAPATVNRRIQALRKFYTYAVGQGRVSDNPADEVALLGETVSGRSRFLTSDDVERLLEAVSNGRRRWVDRDRAVMQVFLGAGLKLSELTQLQLVDAHLDAIPARLDVRDAKGARDRSIPLGAEVQRAIEGYLRTRHAGPGVGHLFVNRDGRPLSTRSVQRLLRNYARMAQLSDLTTQALRYRYARSTYDACHDPETVAHLLGHRHLATTVRFLRPGPTQAETPAAPRARDASSTSEVVS